MISEAWGSFPSDMARGVIGPSQRRIKSYGGNSWKAFSTVKPLESFLGKSDKRIDERASDLVAESAFLEEWHPSLPSMSPIQSAFIYGVRLTLMQ